MDSRIIKHALEIYTKKIWIITAFALPFLLSALLIALVPAPTYIALGSLYLRTGSIPNMSLIEIVLTIAAYGAALFIAADVVVNIGIVVKTKRTFTKITSEIIEGAKKYAGKIFVIYTAMIIVLTALQIALYDHPIKNILFGITALLLSFITFFAIPAIIIDEYAISEALKKSAELSVKRYKDVLSWMALLFLTVVLSEIGIFILPYPFSLILMFLLNALIITPFFLVLQMQLYMEKYPLAR